MNRRLLEKLETWGIVTVIAVLVWLYAEGEAVSERQEQMQIQFVAPSGQQLAIEPSTPQPVVVTFRGSTGQMAQIRRIIEGGPVKVEVRDVNSGNQLEPPVIVKDKLQNSPLGELGVNIVESNPATLPAWVEPLVTAGLDVAVQTGDTHFASPPMAEPMRVNVTLPANLSDRARQLRVIANLDEVDLTQYTVNESHTVEVPLQLPGELRQSRWAQWISLEQPTARVTFTIRNQTDTVTLTSVPIHVNAPPLTLQQFSIQPPEDWQVLPEVTLSGPSDVIDRIREGQTRVWAELWPRISELEEGTTELPVHLRVPPSVTVKSILPTVPVTVRRLE